jgi:capsular exopolysaccharide synthesis family protein
MEKYVPDKLAMLRSKALVDKVVKDPGITGGQPINPLDDPAADLIKNLYTRNVPGTSYFAVSYEGGDPAKITRTLNVLLEEFKQVTRDQSQDLLVNSKGSAQAQIGTLKKEIADIQASIYKVVRESDAIGPGGTSLRKERLELIKNTIYSKQMRQDDLERSLHMETARPQAQGPSPREEAKALRISELAKERAMLEKRLKKIQMTARNSRDDPAARNLWIDIQEITKHIAEIEAEPVGVPAEAAGFDDGEVILARAGEEIRALQADADRELAAMQSSMPQYDLYFQLVTERDLKQKQLADTAQHLSEFDALSKTQKEPVNITVRASEPVNPERPKRGLYIAGFVMFGLMLGVGLSCLIEHVDHSVKVPEHLTAGLSLPLLGVVPRIRRTALVHRGGHLWTPGLPDSIEADAYRNVRASLLGVAGVKGPIVTLLVTSAKAGEGKSTTALNLAATCARAGERTLLVDVDLRRPSLAGVFPHDDGHLGLVDVLRGDLPWQRVVVATDLPNLDFLPTGETRDVPIEILGSLELRQLLLSLSQHHYDRVILDGPAVLGLADCRTLGRIVDSAVMVVRSGTMELRPLRRAKGMLEQSQVPLAGVIFNGLSDDLDNWSSYGPSPSPPPGPSRRLDALAASS